MVSIEYSERLEALAISSVSVMSQCQRPLVAWLDLMQKPESASLGRDNTRAQGVSSPVGFFVVGAVGWRCRSGFARCGQQLNAPSHFRVRGDFRCGYGVQHRVSLTCAKKQCDQQRVFPD